MKIFFVLFALMAAASAAILPPVLVSKVNVAPTQVNVVRQPITVTHAEPILRSVPVPVRAITYTSPEIVTPIVAAPAVAANPVFPYHVL